ncbi:MAG: hypothetical protein FWH17_05690 [Oscillospiraceae bacterium]|nr:hypothetical protein [Oscillospiraceae bacterium]
MDTNGDISPERKTATITVYSFVILYVLIINVFNRMRFKQEVVDRINLILVELIRCVEYASDLKYSNISAIIYQWIDLEVKRIGGFNQ